MFRVVVLSKYWGADELNSELWRRAEDAYFQAVQATSEKHHGDSGVLLGFVIAHELGHLLLGAGHTPDGVMQAAWGQRQMDALRQRWLKFNEENATRIRRGLDTRTARK